MKNKQWLFPACIFLFAACGQTGNDVSRLMAQAEALLEHRPDSALQCLKAVEEPAGLPEARRMNYDLLLLQAKSRAGEAVCSDTLIAAGAKNYFSRKKEFPRAAMAAFYEGFVLSKCGETRRALQAYLDAERLVKNAADSLLMARIARNIGILYYNSWSDYQNAIPHLQRAVGLFEKTENEASYIVSLRFLGTCLIIDEKEDEAIVCFEKALRKAEASSDTVTYAEIANSLGSAYINKGDYQQAKIYTLQAVAFVGNRESLLNMALIYDKLNRHDSAAFYARRVGQLCDRDGLPYPSSLNALWANIEKRNRRFEKALYYLEEYVRQIFEINKEEKLHSLARIQEQYSLTEAQNKIQQQQIIQLHYNVFLLCAAFIIAIVSLCAGFWLRSYLKKTKMHEQQHLEERTTFFRDKMTIYKRILQIVLSMKKSEKEQAAALLAKINYAVFNTDGEHVWDTVYSDTNLYFNKNMEKIKRRFSNINEQEFKILCLTCADFKNSDIASYLQISIHTVKAKKRMLRKKLDIPAGSDIVEFVTGKSE
jgi:tetratricopeptide (TPR) repeat protein